MINHFPNSAQLPQFDAPRVAERVVLLGASNASIAFPHVIESTRAALGGPLEFFVAMGFGRSYGKESKFFGKKFSGILHTGLWESLRASDPKPTAALVADVGNDLAYEALPETIADWVAESLDRLAAAHARTALNNVPRAALAAVGPVRYYALREALFPSCRIRRGEMLRRVDALSDALARLAASREIPVFSGEKSWYGADPIHPRRGARGEIWRRLIGALTPAGTPVAWRRADPRDARRLRAAQRSAWLARTPRDGGPKAHVRLSDGSSVFLF